MTFLRLATAFIAACLLVVWRIDPAAAQAQLEGLVQTEVTTSTGSKGVMIRPFAPGPYPGVLHLHGSGETVAKSLVILRLFARAGYVAMDIEYPEVTGTNSDIQDAVASLEFLRSSRFVRRGVIGLNGFSRGGRAALRLAAMQDVRAVSAIGVRTTTGNPPTILDEADRLKMPILLQHGVDDAGPAADMVLLERKLKSLKRRVQLVSYRGAGHNDMPWDLVYQRVLEFFRDNLR